MLQDPHRIVDARSPRIKLPPLLVLLTFLAFWIPGPLRAQVPVQVFFGPPAEKGEPGLDTHFIRFVESAEKTLDCAFYELRLETILKALVDAKERGVLVRFLVDDENYHRSGTDRHRTRQFRNVFIIGLEKAGIEVVKDNSPHRLMHNKFAIADGKRAWTGSFNITNTGAFRNENNGIWIEDADIADMYTAEFEEMFVRKQFGRDSESRVAKQSKTYGTESLEVYFAPEDDPLARVREILEGARNQVAFMQFAFTDNGISKILINRRDAGVDVRGIFDHLLYRANGPYGEFARLSASNIPVIIHNGRGKFHHKVFVVDPEGENPVVVMGSENASLNGNEVNDENVVIIRSREVARSFMKEFERKFGKLSTATVESLLSEAAVTNSEIAVVDLVIAANGRKINDISITMPARWELNLDRTKVRVFASREADLMPARHVAITENAIILSGLDIPAFGTRSHITIRLRNVAVPKIPGFYTPTVAVWHPQEAAHLPLEFQPTIKILAADDPDLIVGVLSHIREMLMRMGGLTHLPAEETNVYQSRHYNGFHKAREIILNALREGQHGPMIALISMFDTLDADERVLYIKLLGKATVLRRALSNHAREGDRMASRLRERLDGILSLNLVAK